MHLPSRQLGTSTPKHWHKLSENYSALPSFQQYPVIPTTAHLMMVVSFFSKKTLSCFSCFILFSGAVLRNKQKIPHCLLPWTSSHPHHCYLHSLSSQLVPLCPSTTVQSLPLQPTSIPFWQRDGWGKTVPKNVISGLIGNVIGYKDY